MGKIFERIVNARLTFVCDDYIDYTCDRFIGQAKLSHPERRFAKIDRKDFPEYEESGQKHDAYESLIDALYMAIKDDARLNLVIEKRDVLMEHANPQDKSHQKIQKTDFLVKVDWTWCGEGE